MVGGIVGEVYEDGMKVWKCEGTSTLMGRNEGSVGELCSRYWRRTNEIAAGELAFGIVGVDLQTKNTWQGQILPNQDKVQRSKYN